MNILEKEIEDVVWESSGIQLRERGLYLKIGSLKFRQLNLGSYGIADIVTFKFVRETQLSRVRKYTNTEWVLQVDVLELKKEEVNIGTLLQAVEYCKGVQRFLEKRIDGNFQYRIEFGIVLIGKKIEMKSAFCFMPDFFKNLSLYTYQIDLEKGIRFNSHDDYNHIDEVLPPLDNYLTMENIKRMLETKSSEVKHWVDA
jgi:hypothetical protein